jgi:hypothetical protein
MGYHMAQIDSSFVIPEDLVAEALLSLKEEMKNRFDFWKEIVDCDAVIRAPSLDEALQLFQWKTYTDGNGTLNGILFVGKVYRDDDQLFSIIAPYAYSGSYVIMRGEDGAIWRWLIDANGRCKEQEGSIHFE